MAKVFTQEEREKIKGQVVELVRQSGRETLRQLEAKTGATRYLMSVLARVNRPGFPGECFICELRLPDHRFRWKH
uniref:DUF977 family protein n=1 Tax=Escherichia coli TaxID=562 RepID=UPI001FCCE07B